MVPFLHEQALDTRLDKLKLLSGGLKILLSSANPARSIRSIP